MMSLASDSNYFAVLTLIIIFGPGLHNPQSSIQSLTHPPPWCLWPHHCYANGITQTPGEVQETSSEVQVCTEGSSSTLQFCFNTIRWGMFKQANTYNQDINIQEYAVSVTAYCTSRYAPNHYMGQSENMTDGKDLQTTEGSEQQLVTRKPARAKLSCGIKKPNSCSLKR